MGLPIPDLDDKNFNDMVEEARILISRYAPEWTDHNVHDPGITFVELFAWLAEMQIYQMNRVTENNCRKFLKLVGRYPYTARPSRVEITFDNVTDKKNIEAGSQIPAKVDGDEVVFETEEDYTLIPVNFKSIITSYNSKTIDNTRANETDNIYFAAFGENGAKGAEFRLEFTSPLPKLSFKIIFHLFEKDLKPAGGNKQSQIIPPVHLEWEYLSGEKWISFIVNEDTTQDLTRSGGIIFAWPPDIGTDTKDISIMRCCIMDGQYEIAPLIDRILLNTIQTVQTETIRNDFLGESTGLPDQSVFLDKKPIIVTPFFDLSLLRMRDILNIQSLLQRIKYQAQSEKNSPGKRICSRFDQDIQVMINNWDSSQMPDPILKSATLQALNEVLEDRNLYDADSFNEIRLSDKVKRLIGRLDIITDSDIKILNRLLIKAAYPDIITVGRPIIQVMGDDSKYETWIEVEDFESSGPEDPHYTVDPQKGEITFGNGLNGSIPFKEHEIRALFYQTTLGSKGNINNEQKFLFEGIPGENLQDAAGGMDAQSLNDATSRARRDCRTIYRAITSNDYEYLALSTPGLRVARAKTIPNYDPEYPCISIPGSVTVVVVPYARAVTGNPTPGYGFIQTVRDHLDKYRLITTDIHVIKPEYIRIHVKCKIRIQKYSSETKVEERVIKALDDFLLPLSREQDKKEWPFGRAVYPSEIYQKIDEIEGVDYTTDVFIRTDEEPYQKSAITIPESGLVFSGKHEIEFI